MNHLTTIRCIQLPMGAALAEGRAPSHDGEYLSLYYRNQDRSEWICESNGGVTATHCFTHEDNEHTDEAEALDARIAEALAAPGDDANPMQSCGTEAKSLMLEFGWATAEQFDGNTLVAPPAEVA